MSKGLNSLNEMVIHLNSKYGKTQEALEDFRNIEKELEALEILKNKEVNVHALLLHLKRFDKPDGYNVLVGTKYQITQEEYNILKEALL